MKLTDTLFKCDWCGHEQTDVPKKGKFHGQIICQKSGHKISQKTESELKG